MLAGIGRKLRDHLIWWCLSHYLLIYFLALLAGGFWTDDDKKVSLLPLPISNPVNSIEPQWLGLTGKWCLVAVGKICSAQRAGAELSPWVRRGLQGNNQALIPWREHGPQSSMDPCEEGWCWSLWGFLGVYLLVSVIPQEASGGKKLMYSLSQARKMPDVDARKLGQGLQTSHWHRLTDWWPRGCSAIPCLKHG